MYRDPVCGAPVDFDATPPELKVVIRGETYAFCSVRCLMAFEEEKLPILLKTRAPAFPARKICRKNGKKPPRKRRGTGS
ncbi:MAG: hypothetical protein V2G42_03860 [bacterium JZ-2024 1]